MRAVARIVLLLASLGVAAASQADDAPALLTQLAAAIQSAPAPTVWARLHRMLALGPSDADIAFTFTHVRPPTALTPYPHFFDSDDDAEDARSDVTESHAAQVTLALVALLGTRAPFTVAGRQFFVHDLFRGEQARPIYAAIVRDISQLDAARCPLDATASARDLTIPRLELARLDLTWFIEAAALTARDRQTKLMTAWTDVDGHHLSLAELLRAQERLYDINTVCADRAFLAERGVHTIGMLLRVAPLLTQEDASLAARQLAIGRRWLKALTAALLSSSAPSAADYGVMAHVLEIARCADGHALSALDMETLTTRVLAYLTPIASRAPFSIATHAVHALGGDRPTAQSRGRFPCTSF